ncbi:hypothetical protein, partial [Paraburkholderia sp. UCT31]|uniref:hypothetical protein n=1 Tax=Paraburkholderia sp. UCT31 TaxID=2615209 RepID=UPI001CA3CAA3
SIKTARQSINACQRQSTSASYFCRDILKLIVARLSSRLSRHRRQPATRDDAVHMRMMRER